MSQTQEMQDIEMTNVSQAFVEEANLNLARAHETGAVLWADQRDGLGQRFFESFPSFLCGSARSAELTPSHR